MNTLSHIDNKGNASMVDVSTKTPTQRKATARAIVFLGTEILAQLQNHDIISKKGSVFQTAIIAGVMAAKKTGELIPLCHPLGLDDCQITIQVVSDTEVMILGSATVFGKTGIEMEALTAVSIAALTLYDMCKAMSHNIVIKEIRLIEKTGGKKDFKFEA